MLTILKLSLCCLLLGFVNSDQPFILNEEINDLTPEIKATNENELYRLPTNVIPLEYDIDIELYFDETPQKSAYTYDGKVKIVIQALEQNINQIVFHINVDEVKCITLLADDTLVAINNLSPIIFEPQYHFLRINTAENLIVGRNYTLLLEYSSTMNETPLTRGIWRGQYVDADGVERIYATTHFQPYNARQAFPCWDEPLFKAVFTLHLTSPSRYTGVFSNTGIANTENLPGDRVKNSFYATPKMSSYLVTFLVSETFDVIAEDTTHEPPIRIIARSNVQGLGAHALTLAVGLTDHFDEYFDWPYSTLHRNLYNDHVASPDWASAGTENWGMVSYRELHLILDERETIMSVEHYSATLVSHELAHKWFGNLITCYWWSNTWINEGFASYFGYIATHQVFPKYDMHEHFNSRYLQTSLAVDSGVNTVPLNHNVNTPLQVTGHFGTISYSKGAAFLRMIADMITEETFKKACRYFLQDNAYEATDQYDLHRAFVKAIDEDNSLQEYLDFNFTQFYSIWVNEPGYPILTINIDHSNGEIKLTQERFFLDADANPSEQIYPIPITYSTKNSPVFTQIKPLYMMAKNTDTITISLADNEWVIFNNLQHGHYRVNYDQESWNLIAGALLSEPDLIHHLNRAQIVDDVFALMRSERMTHIDGFKILQFLKHESNYHVWNPAISGYTWLRNRLRHLPEDQAKLDELILSYMEHVIEDLGFDVDGLEETPTVSLTRQEILHFACMLGHEHCVQESRMRFINFKQDEENWVNPRIRRNVFVVGIRMGNEEDYNFLYNRMIQSNIANDQLEMMRALGATRDTNILLRYLAMTITQDVRPHDKVNAFNYALLGNPENAHTVLQFVKTNIDDIRRTYVPEAASRPVNSALSSLASYLDESGLNEMEDWLTSTQADSAEYIPAMNSISASRSNIAWGDRHVNQIMAAVRGGAVQTLASLLLITALSLIAMAV